MSCASHSGFGPSEVPGAGDLIILQDPLWREDQPVELTGQIPFADWHVQAFFSQPQLFGALQDRVDGLTQQRPDPVNGVFLQIVFVFVPQIMDLWRPNQSSDGHVATTDIRIVGDGPDQGIREVGTVGDFHINKERSVWDWLIGITVVVIQLFAHSVNRIFPVHGSCSRSSQKVL